jgi:hypothetical protein
MSRAGRPISLALLSFAVALPGAAGEPSTPASILAAMQKSKLTYSIGEPGSVKNPVKDLDCPSRQSNMRVVAKPAALLPDAVRAETARYIRRFVIVRAANAAPKR